MPDDRATIMIHDLADARAALKVAKELDLPVRLISPPGAPAYLGIDYFQDVAQAAHAEFPDADVQFVLDCDDQVGFALVALRQGVERISVRVDDEVRRRIEDVAAQLGAGLEEITGPVLDLEYADDPAAACRDWLTKWSAAP